jgi:hypothetical protein
MSLLKFEVTTPAEMSSVLALGIQAVHVLPVKA